jgi:hypothetical protein
MNIVLGLFLVLYLVICVAQAIEVREDWAKLTPKKRKRLCATLLLIALLTTVEVIGRAFSRSADWLIERLRDWIGLNGDDA